MNKLRWIAVFFLAVLTIMSSLIVLNPIVSAVSTYESEPLCADFVAKGNWIYEETSILNLSPNTNTTITFFMNSTIGNATINEKVFLTEQISYQEMQSGGRFLQKRGCLAPASMFGARHIRDVKDSSWNESARLGDVIYRYAVHIPEVHVAFASSQPIVVCIGDNCKLGLNSFLDGLGNFGTMKLTLVSFTNEQVMLFVRITVEVDTDRSNPVGLDCQSTVVTRFRNLIGLGSPERDIHTCSGDLGSW